MLFLSPSARYILQEIKTILNSYVTDKGLVNAIESQYINIDGLLLSTLTSSKSNETLEFVKRDELIKRLTDRMQNWYEIQVEGKEPVLKYVALEKQTLNAHSLTPSFTSIRKGQLKPVCVIVKIRQGRKASTLITNFEPFFLTADFLAEELRRTCASATSGSSLIHYLIHMLRHALCSYDLFVVFFRFSISCTGQEFWAGSTGARQTDQGCH